MEDLGEFDEGREGGVEGNEKNSASLDADYEEGENAGEEGVRDEYARDEDEDEWDDNVLDEDYEGDEDAGEELEGDEDARDADGWDDDDDDDATERFEQYEEKLGMMPLGKVVHEQHVVV
jgi:hypothetical protein